MGMLLKEIEPAKNQRDVSARGGESPSRKQAIRDAGVEQPKTLLPAPIVKFLLASKRVAIKGGVPPH